MNKVTGLDEIKKALNEKIKDIENANIRGFIKSVILIRNTLEKNTPVVPVDLGNLRASFYSVTAKGVGQKISEFIGQKDGHTADAGQLQADYMKAVNDAMTTVLSMKGQVAVMGFSANYAWWVHENVGDVNWNRAGSGAKFFEKALEVNKKQILKIIADEAKNVM